MNYQESHDFLKNNILARVPLINLISIERKRSINLIKEVMKELTLDVYFHTLNKGTVNSNGDNISSDKTILGCFDFINNELASKSNLTFVITNESDLLSDTVASRYLLDLLNSCEQHNSTIIVLSNEPLWSLLQKYGTSLILDYPNEKEIYDITKEMVNPYLNTIKIEWTEENFKEVGSILLGLSEMEIKNVIAMLIAKKELLLSDLSDLKFAKDSMFNNIEGLEKIDVDKNLSFAGLDNLKEWLLARKQLLVPSKREEMIKRGMNPPRGMLLVGIPGCGKSLCAKVVSLMWDMPLYLLDFATVQGMYVGQSEQQLKAAFDAAEQVSPCILWIDEIEKGLAASSADSSGVTTKLVGQFLFWLQECKKQVFVVATANDVSKLPPELLRKGRFDELFFVDLPNTEERKLIINMYIQKYLRVKLGDNLLNNLVTLTDKFTSSDIECVIRDIAYKQIENPEFKLTETFLIDSIKNAVSLSNTNPEAIAKIKEWAKGRTINASK